MHLPEIAALQEKLRNHLSPAEFARTWKEGQTLDLQAVVIDVSFDSDRFGMIFKLRKGDKRGINLTKLDQWDT